ncbi:MAG: LicD family protein [Clostridia bacterium]|nr:LicD family protein [Clostridia bacterium]
MRNLQLKSLELLLYFKKICEENSLRFYLCGGCCIGAVRHQGFIPWDDDVDVFMKREDYEKLEKIWAEKADTSRYSYCRPSKDKNYRNLFATINDNNTTFIKTHQADLDINHGLALDILPLDGYPNEKYRRFLQIFWALIYSLFCAEMVPVNHGKLIKFIGKILLGIFRSHNIRYKIWSFAEKQMKKYKISDCENITELCSGPFYMMKKYPKNAFEKATNKNFEGYEMPIPTRYDEYLKAAFGDYMRLPPEEKRVPHHEAVFWDLNNSYKKYKGKYYCTEDK